MNMRRKRSVESQNFLRTRTSGHLLAALALEAGKPLDVAPTVEVKDYPAAADLMVEINQDVLRNEKSKELQKWDQWDQELGLVAFNANTPPEGDAVVAMQTRQVMQEFWSRFRGRALLISRSVGGPAPSRLRASEGKQKQENAGGPGGGPNPTRLARPSVTLDKAFF